MGLQICVAKPTNFLEDTVKKIVAMLVLIAVSAMLFACDSPGASTTTQSTIGTTDTGLPDISAGEPVTPYADIDFSDGGIIDKNGVITLEIKKGATEEGAYVEKIPVHFKGIEKVLPVLCIKEESAWVKGTFSEFEDNTEFDAFVAEKGGFSIEVFYLDNSMTEANRGIVCSTESVGGDSKRSGWGIAETAHGAPYFITGHAAENEYSSVYAAKASEEDFVHVVGVYNGKAKRNAIYVNGSLVSSDSVAGAFTSANKLDIYENFNMATVFYIGADPAASPGKEHECDFPANDLMVLDVKFYSCALDEAQVKAVFAESIKAFG